MGGFRASDADRDRYVEVIEAAYADGQLGDADRELRVSRALTAETLDELQSLTRDLRHRPVPVATAPPQDGTASAVVPRRLAGVVAGLGALVVLLGAGVFGLVVFSSPEGPGTPSMEASGEAVPMPVDDGLVEAPSFEMTAPGVRRFLRAYERKFGTLDAYEAGFYPARVGVQVPVRGSRPRMERWSWDGGWRQDTEASRVTGPSGLVDLAGLDVRRLFANIETAQRTLRVERGRLSHVLLDTWTDGLPTVNIHIANSFGESGYLKTTMSGVVVRAFPYDA